MSQKDYDKAVTMYREALNVINKSDSKSKLSKAERLQQSKKALDYGMTFFDNKDYSNAYLAFKGVLEEDTTNYDNAMKKEEESKNLYVSEGIDKANNFASAGDYASAIKSLTSALSVDSNNKEIIDLRTKYQSNIDAKAKADADAKAIANAKAAKEYDEQQAKKAEEAKQKRKSEGVRIGMTKDEVLGSSWGQPKSVNKTTGSYGTNEQWVYEGNNYLYFKNGILTTIQN